MRQVPSDDASVSDNKQGGASLAVVRQGRHGNLLPLYNTVTALMEHFISTRSTARSHVFALT
jgi:hypothetical protein